MSEFVEVKLKLPQSLVDFLKHHENSIGGLEHYLAYNIIQVIEGDIKESNCVFFNSKREIERWGLKEILDC